MIKIAIESTDGTIDITELADDADHGYVLLTFAREGEGYEVETSHDTSYPMLKAGVESLRHSAKAALQQDMQDTFDKLSPKSREFAAKVGLTAENFMDDPVMRMLMGRGL